MFATTLLNPAHAEDGTSVSDDAPIDPEAIVSCVALGDQINNITTSPGPPATPVVNEILLHVEEAAAQSPLFLPCTHVHVADDGIDNNTNKLDSRNIFFIVFVVFVVLCMLVSLYRR